MNIGTLVNKAQLKVKVLENTEVKSIANLASYIDHTLLKMDATSSDIEKLCEDALTHKFRAVCVNPIFVSLVRKNLTGLGILTCGVVGFPLGANKIATKLEEAKAAIQDGAEELDTVMSIGKFKAKEFNYVEKEISKIVKLGIPVKVIIETAVLTDEEKIIATNLVKKAGAQFVKTSTGFTGGATLFDVALLKEIVGEELGIKASGGIRDFRTCVKMLQAGATRIGTSSGVKILEEAR